MRDENFTTDIYSDVSIGTYKYNLSTEVHNHGWLREMI